jgi:hypothetical protein
MNFNIPGLIPDQHNQNGYGQKQYPWDMDPLKFYPPGQDLQRKDRHDIEYERQKMEEVKEMMKQYTRQMPTTNLSKRSAFEILIDTLFSTSEKEQFIIDCGWKLEAGKDGGYVISKELANGDVSYYNGSIHTLFLEHITVKFKNLLLAKPKLTIKI